MQFVERQADQLLVDGRPFRITGGNVYYLGYVEEGTIHEVLEQAERAQMNVLRIWAFSEAALGVVHFQRWDEDSGRVVVNGGLLGLERLDRAVFLAGERGLRLILTLGNYWKDFGGVPAYLQWFGLKENDDFYTDARCREAYRAYVEQLLNRRNVYTGRRYSEEPAVLAWDLMNEPRARDPEVLLAWIAEMSAFVRVRAPRQLIGSGDEGFFGANGVDFERILALDTIDIGTYHLYSNWVKRGDAGEFGRKWIQAHVAAGKAAEKPVLLEEYGATRDRVRIYEAWLRQIYESNALGSLVWMLGARPGPAQPYALDEYVLEEESELQVVRDHAGLMRQGS